MFVRSREENLQLVFLLQLLNYNLLLTGELQRKTCSSVGRVLQLCASKVDLVLTGIRMSVRGAAALFRYTTHLHSLRQEAENTPVLYADPAVLPVQISSLWFQTFQQRGLVPVSVGQKRQGGRLSAC